MTSRSSYVRRRSNRRQNRRTSLSIERLEARFVLDGELATLAADLFEIGQNSATSSLDVLSNDVFASEYAGARRITSISYGSEGGSIEIAADGKQLLYAPPADFFGSESFVYVVDDQLSAQVRIDVRAPLTADAYTIPPDGAQRTLDVLANDPFWANYAGAREITSVSVASAGGRAVIATDRRSVLYTPPDDAFGTDEFIYIVDGIYPARVTITVPDALKPDQLEVVQHTQATFNLLANDPFWAAYDGDRRITHVLDADEGAIVAISSDGHSIIYTPAPDAAGGDSLRYVVDGKFEGAANIAIHRPVSDDSFEIDQNSTNQSFNVVANDLYRDLGNALRDVVVRVTAVTQPASGGTVSIADDGQSVVYTPPAGFSGSDEFTYLADGVHEAHVRVQVNRSVRDDYIYQGVYQDTGNAILNVLANDFLGNGYLGPRVITSVGAAEHGGVVSIGGGGKWLVYTPPPGYSGPDAFTYAVDGALEARVTLSVQALAQGDYYLFEADPALGSYTLNVLSNDFFRQGYQGPGIITGIRDLSGSGTVSIVGGQTLKFVPGPTGSLTFKYVVDDKYEATASASIRNRLQSDAAVVDQNSAAQTVNVLPNDFAVYYPYGSYVGPRLITSVGTSTRGGVVSISADGKSVTYQPPADFSGDDQFTYTVDGIMQATVDVHVIRRVRDDQFRVDHDSANKTLPLLVNDLFGADYQGARRITGLTATTGGGTVTISADGRSVQYAPAAGFSGTDSFVYTVDGRLKAQVHVVVDADRAHQFPMFGSMEDYQQFLIDDALVRYDQLFGRPAWYGWTEDGVANGPVATGSATPRDHSDTNVQVAGIDEGDIIEFDSDYVYVLTDKELVIVDAWPAEEAKVASRVKIEGHPLAEFLSGDRLTVISQLGGEYFPVAGGPLIDIGPAFPYRLTPSTTLVTVIDVSQRSAPMIVQTTSMEGGYVDSRAVGDFVYVLVNNQEAVAPPPLVITDGDPAEPPVFPSGVYETREAYLARVTANPGEMVAAALPNYTAYGPDGKVVRTGLLNEPEGIYRPLDDDARSLISVVSFNIHSDEPGLAATAAVYTTGASTLYASLENFYVFDHDYSPEDGAQTRIMKFDWDPASGGIDFAASTTVAGSIVNQFSADEFDGYLRIATTIDNRGAGNWSDRAANQLFVLQEDQGVFEFVGSLQNLALDESIKSIRFTGDQAFVTTFRTIDPLFGLDLTDPANPRALGHLTLPGFATYMQFIDATHLLTVGQNTPAGVGGPTQVALYDVSDITHPRRIDEYTFERFSTSEAQVDHHAFGYFAVHGLLAIPTSRTFIERVDEDGDGYRETRKTVREDELSVLTIDVNAGSSAIALTGEIPHDTAVRRSGYIDAYLYSASGDSVKVVRADDPGHVIAEVRLAEPDDDPPVPIDPGSLPATSPFPATTSDAALADAIHRAQADLAGRMHSASGASMVVTSEATSSAATGGYRVVLRAGNDQYLYYVRGDKALVLANESFVFPDAQDSGAWHAVAVASPLVGDFNFDGRVSADDLPVWRAANGFDAAGDADGDGDSDNGDFLLWQRHLGETAQQSTVSGATGDFDADGDADGADFLAWQRGVGRNGATATTSIGDANRDRRIDAGDLAFWKAGFAAAEAPAAPLAAMAPDGGQELLDLAPAITNGSPLFMQLVDVALEDSFGESALNLLDDGMIVPSFAAPSADSPGVAVRTAPRSSLRLSDTSDDAAVSDEPFDERGLKPTL